MYALKEYAEAELPDPQAAIEQGLAFVDGIEKDWVFAKEFHGGVRTYKHWEGSDYWVARASEHTDASYEDMLATLYHDHTSNEAEYIKMIELQKPLDSAGAYASNIVTYKFPFPLRNRDMVIWSTKKETVPGSQFVVVTLPRKIQTRHTKGLYVSVEVVTKLSDNKVKWQMATTSDAGGWVPQFVQRPQLPAAVAEDIPSYMTWLKQWKQKHNNAGTSPR